MHGLGSGKEKLAVKLNVNPRRYGGYIGVGGTEDQSAGSFVSLAINEHGGGVTVFGKGEGKAAMSINEYGNGDVSAWDKNGYRQ